MDYKKTKEQLNNMLKDNHKNFIKALISIETGINNQDDLDYIYNIYMSQDNFNLLNDEFDTIIEYSRIIDFKNAISKTEQKVEKKESVRESINKMKEQIKETVTKDKMKNKYQEQSL